MNIEITILIIFCVISFFMWSFLHELSHATIVKKFVQDVKVSYKLYPHFESGLGFVWASMGWKYQKKFEPKIEQLGWIFFAPRIIDFAGVLLTVILAKYLPESNYKIFLLILTGGSILDLCWGSIGYGENSDLQRYCRYWGWNPVWPRVIGFIVGIIASTLSVSFVL